MAGLGVADSWASWPFTPQGTVQAVGIQGAFRPPGKGRKWISSRLFLCAFNRHLSPTRAYKAVALAAWWSAPPPESLIRLDQNPNPVGSVEAQEIKDCRDL